MRKVTLSKSEVAMAAGVGILRHIAAISRQLADKHGFDGESGWQVHIEGACGELAYAKSRGVFWEGTVNTFKRGGDVGLDQVRTRSKHYHDLIVREEDAEDARFVCVTGTAPVYHVWGWIYARDAKRPEWWQTYGNRPGAYFVPKTALRSFDDATRMAA